MFKILMKKIIVYFKLTLLVFFVSFSNNLKSQNLKLLSPDKLIEIKIQSINQLKFQVSLKNNVIIKNVDIGIEMSDGRSIGSKSKVIATHAILAAHGSLPHHHHKSPNGELCHLAIGFFYRHNIYCLDHPFR